LATVRANGWQFAALKATQGTTISDAWFARDYTKAAAAGLDVTGYHFWSNSSSPTTQANSFIGRLRAVGYTGLGAGQLPPVLDLEGCTTTTTVGNVKTFLTAVESAFGITPWIYTSNGEYRNCLGSATGLGGYRLWVACYGCSSPVLPPGFSGWLLW